MTMPLRSAPPPPTQASPSARQRTKFAESDDWARNHSNYSQTKYEERKAPPPRPPPPKFNKDSSKSTSSNVFSNLFGKSKTNNTTKNSVYSSSQLFSLPPPPGAKGNSFTNHLSAQQQQQSHPSSLVELISFDSPPSSPTPSRSTPQMGPPLAGLDLLDSDPPSFGGGFGFASTTAAPSSNQKSSGFEDSFVAWDTSDPFSPLPAQMPTFEPRSTLSTAPREFRSDFLDPLCNGKSLLAPQPVVTMPTIIKPTKPMVNVRTPPKTQLPSMSSGYGSGSVSSEATISSSSSLSSTMSYYTQEESYAIVLYDFESLQDGDLSLRANDKIYLIRQINDDWYYGRKKSGQEGMFPASYVEVKVPLNPAGRLEEPPAPSPTPSTQSTTIPTKRARVAFDFAAQTADDLTLRANDVVTLLYAINDDWWFGELGQRRGQFPAAFVDII